MRSRAGIVQMLGRSGAAVTHYVLDVIDANGHPAQLELAIRRETVEYWYVHRCRGVGVRDALRRWLAAPRGELTCDDITWRYDSGVYSIAVRAALPPWPLAPHVVADLRDRI